MAAKEIEPGQMNLYPYCPPPLPSGDYELVVGHDMKSDDPSASTSTLDLPGSSSSGFRVDGPRFILAPTEIHSIFPPANARGNYSRRLPQIVLRRRTLPWERKISGQDTKPPWLALLVFDEDEINDPSLVEEHSGISIREIADGSSGKPDLTLSEDEKKRTCLSLDVDRELFAQICPRMEELDLLTHVRQVNTDDKELLGQDEDGWFSVIVANRLPKSDCENKVYLVSLEGHAANLPEQDNATGQQPDKITLVVLATWKFSCRGKADFQGTMTAIPDRGGIGLLGMAQKDTVSDPSTVKEPPPAVTPSGHIPLPQSFRNGDLSAAFYRGPFTPDRITHEAVVCHHAHQALIIDPVSGLEQVGYASAFELGRLLALSDSKVAIGLLEWRKPHIDNGFTLSVVNRIERWFNCLDPESIEQAFLYNLREILDPSSWIMDSLDMDILTSQVMTVNELGYSQNLFNHLQQSLAESLSFNLGVDMNQTEAFGNGESFFNQDSLSQDTSMELNLEMSPHEYETSGYSQAAEQFRQSVLKDLVGGIQNLKEGM